MSHRGPPRANRIRASLLLPHALEEVAVLLGEVGGVRGRRVTLRAGERGRGGGGERRDGERGEKNRPHDGSSLLSCGARRAPGRNGILRSPAPHRQGEPL